MFYYMPHTFYRSIFDYYMESAYFDYDWENFFMDDIGLCEKNDRCRTKFDCKRQLRRRRTKRNRPLLEEIAGSFVCSLRLTR